MAPTKGAARGTKTVAEGDRAGTVRREPASSSPLRTPDPAMSPVLRLSPLVRPRAATCSNRWASRGGATAQAQAAPGRPAQDSNDRITTTLSSSSASGKSENSENSANRSSTTTAVHARDKRTASAGERIDPSGFDGESMTANPFRGISEATSGPITASQATPRAIDTSRNPQNYSAIRFAVAEGGNATRGPA